MLGVVIADGSTKNTITNVNKLSIMQVYLCIDLYRRRCAMFSGRLKNPQVNSPTWNKCQRPVLYAEPGYFRNEKHTMI